MAIEIKLKHPDTNAERYILREGEMVLLMGNEGEELEQNMFKSELTAKAYFNFILLFLKEKGYNRE